MKLELRRVKVASPGVQDARRRWPERESLLVRLRDRDGHTGIGEASPLPGYSRDALGEVESALAGLPAVELESALSKPVPREALTAVASLVSSGLPSARMALESAALDLLGKRRGLAAPLLLGGAPQASRALAQLLGPACSATLEADAERALADGFLHLKLKLGAPGMLQPEIAAISRLGKRLGSGVSLRLDANGALSSAELELAWSELGALGVELFEEPGSVPEALLGTLPLALDESLQGQSAAEVEARLRQSRAHAIVLKPMALGGLTHCLELAERARQLGAGVVVSHCFDGPFAFRASAALALALPEGLAHGLAPHAGLAGWSLRGLPVERGRLEAWPEPGLGAPAEHGFS
jgi:o-succinylbenzoate synthase